MSDYSDKRQQALEACEKVINGLEDEKISVLSALLQCKKIARLVGDIDGQEWLGYEYGGYPRDEKGFITAEAWKKAKEHWLCAASLLHSALARVLPRLMSLTLTRKSVWICR